MSLDISSFVETKGRGLGKNFDNVGRSTWLGTKRFIVYNPSEGWGYRDLNFVQRIFRLFFGVYKDTHIKRIYAQLVSEKEKYQQQEKDPHLIIPSEGCSSRVSHGEKAAPFPWGLFEKIEFSWARAYNLQEAGVSDVSKKQRELTVKCQMVDPALSDRNKKFVYDQIIQSGPLQDCVCYKKYKIPDENSLLKKQMFGQKKQMEVAREQDGFTSLESRDDTLHWIPNYADTYLFALCQGPLLTQDELQVLEHPALAHLKAALDGQGTIRCLRENEVGLITGAYRYVSLDVKSKASNGLPLYGKNFIAVTQRDIISKLHILESPIRSNIFIMAAPHISETLFGQTCRKEHLKQLLIRSIAAFSAIKFEYPTKKIVVHTGNWGSRAFGNNLKAIALLQLAAAHFSGIDRVEYYPLDGDSSFEEAQEILMRIEHDNLNMTIDEFLTYLENNAASLGLLYEKGDGT